MRLLSPCRSLVVLLAMAALPGVAFAQFGSKPSFGTIFNNKTIELSRKLPPIYDLHSKRVQVVVTNAGAGGTTNTELQSEIEKLLTTADSTVQVQAGTADVTINVEITRYVPPRVVTQNVSSRTTTAEIQGGLNVAFRIVENRSRRVIAASVASAEVDHPIETNEFARAAESIGHKKKIYSVLDAENEIIREDARTVASYLVITPEAVAVQLAVGGDLSGSNRLATNYLWSRYLESLSTLKPFDDVRLDAYRLYDIGIANEALAYASSDASASQKYLQEASINYGKAIENRPDEKNFLPAQTRIASALEHFSANKQLKTATAKPGTMAPVGATPPPAPVPEAKGGVLTNDDIVDMVHARVPEDGIIDAIQSSPKVNFDVTPRGLISLSNGGVSANVQKAMRQRAHSTHGAGGL